MVLRLGLFSQVFLCHNKLATSWSTLYLDNQTSCTCHEGTREKQELNRFSNGTHTLTHGMSTHSSLLYSALMPVVNSDANSNARTITPYILRNVVTAHCASVCIYGAIIIVYGYRVCLSAHIHSGVNDATHRLLPIEVPWNIWSAHRRAGNSLKMGFDSRKNRNCSSATCCTTTFCMRDVPVLMRTRVPIIAGQFLEFSSTSIFYSTFAVSRMISSSISSSSKLARLSANSYRKCAEHSFHPL